MSANAVSYPALEAIFEARDERLEKALEAQSERTARKVEERISAVLNNGISNRLSGLESHAQVMDAKVDTLTRLIQSAPCQGGEAASCPLAELDSGSDELTAWKVVKAWPKWVPALLVLLGFAGGVGLLKLPDILSALARFI